MMPAIRCSNPHCAVRAVANVGGRTVRRFPSWRTVRSGSGTAVGLPSDPVQVPDPCPPLIEVEDQADHVKRERGWGLEARFPWVVPGSQAPTVDRR